MFVLLKSHPFSRFIVLHCILFLPEVNLVSLQGWWPLFYCRFPFSEVQFEIFKQKWWDQFVYYKIQQTLKHVRILGWTFHGTFPLVLFYHRAPLHHIISTTSEFIKISIVYFIGLEDEPKERREGGRKIDCWFRKVKTNSANKTQLDWGRWHLWWWWWYMVCGTLPWFNCGPFL